LAAHLGAAKVIYKAQSSLHRGKQPFSDVATQREKLHPALDRASLKADHSSRQ